MTDSELAWIAREYVSGRKQTEIANEIDSTQSAICLGIVQFCRRYGYEVEFRLYSESRRDSARTALQEYRGEFIRPSLRLSFRMDHTLSVARFEHAWLLRAEGCSLREIGERLDVCSERVRQMIRKHGHRVTRALRHANFTINEKVLDR